MEAISNQFYCQNSLTIHYLVNLFKMSYSKTQIMNKVIAYESYPKLSVKNLIDVLKSLGINSSAIKVKPEILKKIQVPFIANIKNGEINRYFVVIKWIKENKVCYYSADEGEIVEEFAYFVEMWTGIVVLIEAENYNVLTINNINSDSEFAEEYKKECVRVIPNFLSDIECKSIIEYTESLGNYSNSKIVGMEGESIVNHTRTSYSINIPSDTIPLFAEIRNRVTDLLKIPESYIEGFQCVRYSEGQQFAPHLDSNKRLNRKYTLLIYLNDDFTGGETYFPELLLKILPVKGSALYFKNEDDNGNAILFSVHAGLRLKKGIKYACNIWVKDRVSL